MLKTTQKKIRHTVVKMNLSIDLEKYSRRFEETFNRSLVHKRTTGNTTVRHRQAMMLRLAGERLVHKKKPMKIVT
jgi:hypothetical protein